MAKLFLEMKRKIKKGLEVASIDLLKFSIKFNI